MRSPDPSAMTLFRVLEYIDNTVALDTQIMQRERSKRTVVYQQSFGHREALINLKARIVKGTL